MTFTEILPALNACLNGLSGVLLFLGWRAIRTGRRFAHPRFMIAALSASALFLVFYVIRVFLTGTHRYPVADWTRTLYYLVLFSHMILAVAVLPLIGRTLFLAAKRRFEAHRKLARLTFPIWAYVSVTGVVVYVMLYHVARWR